MNKGFIFSSIALTALLVLTTACTRPSPEKRAEWITDKISSKLELSKEQEAKLNAVKDAFLEQRKKHEETRKSDAEETKKLILAEKLDSAKVKALMEKKQKQFEAGYEVIFPKIAEFHASLSPAQKQKAVDIIEKFHQD